MRLGRVTTYLPFSYVVDLDNEKMMKIAEDFLFEDITNADMVRDFFEIDSKEDPSLTVEDISEEVLTMLELAYPEVLEEHHNSCQDE